MELTIADFISAADKIVAAMKRESEFLTIDELCAELKCSPTVAGQLCNAKGFPAQKIGREWRVHRPSMIAWFAGRKAAS